MQQTELKISQFEITSSFYNHIHSQAAFP